MSTVGYGDQYPVTFLGRFTLALSAFSGGIVLSMTFVAIGSYLNLTSEENTVLDEVDLSFAAAQAIHEAYQFSLKPKKNYWDFVCLREKVNTFKNLKLQGDEGDSGVTPESLEERIHTLNTTLSELKGSVLSLSKKIKTISN